MRVTLLLPAAVAAACLAGCGDPVERAGKMAAKPAARTIVQALPPPKPKIAVINQGGSFCSVMKAYDWPYIPESQAEIAAMPERNAAKIADVNQHGETFCPGWPKAGEGGP